MKITFVIPREDMSGGVRVVSIYARLLANRGHQVTVISLPGIRKWGMRKRIRKFLVKRSPEPQLSYFDGTDLVRKILEIDRPVVDDDVPDGDVVVATWWETAEWVSKLSVSKGAKVYFIQHHEVFPWLPQERSHATYRLPMHKIVIARWLAETMLREYGDADVSLVRNSVDRTQFFAPIRGKQAVPTVGFLYSDTPFKGVPVTLEVLTRLRVVFPAMRVISFGSSDPAGRLPEWVDFTRLPAQDKIRDLYAACDVWLTASTSEGFNLPAMEAMACRTPLVSTRTGWPEEAIVDGDNGFCVEVDDVEALVAAGARLLRMSDDQWRRCSEAAHRTVSTSSWDRAADEFEQALHRAIGLTKHTPLSN
jgi:glycosyltransferase involved in cell wall biosynthesis